MKSSLFLSVYFNKTYPVMVLEDTTNTSQTSRRGPDTDDFTRGWIIGLAMDAEFSMAEIGRRLNMPRQTVSGIVNAYKKNKQTTVLPRSGRPPVLDGRDERHLIFNVDKKPMEQFSVHQQEFLPMKAVSVTTIRKVLARNGLFSYKPALKPFLSNTHKKKRLAWVNERMDWTQEQWGRIKICPQTQ